MTTANIDPKILDLRQRLSTVLADINANGLEDGEAMYLIGRTVAGICDRAGAANWRKFKAALPLADYDSLLAQMQTEGNQLVADGQVKAAFALQAIAFSLVASRQNDHVLTEGETLLDGVIETTTDNFRRQTAKPAQAN